MDLMTKAQATWISLLIVSTLVGRSESSFDLTVLHTNDLHARIEEIDKYNGICDEDESKEKKCFGGYARIKTKVDQLRKEQPNSILVDGGDQFMGSLWYYFYKGRVMSHFMNIVGYDAMGLGNHEFDDGPEGLAPFLNNATFSALSCNIDTTKTPEISSIKKSVVLSVGLGCVKIGVIGYTTTETPAISNPGQVQFFPEIESIQKEVDRLKSQGINKIIAVGHAGYDVDQEIAKTVTGVDVIVGGHTNTFLYSGSPPSKDKVKGDYPTVVINPDGDKVLVVQDSAYGKYLGNLQVTFDDDGRVTSFSGNPVLLDHTVEKDQEVVDVITNSYLPEIQKKKEDRVGVSFVQLVGDRSVCRRYECNLGNLITDAMVRENIRYSDGLAWSHVAVAMLNGGGIRDDIQQGEVSVADVLKVQPFRNTVDIVEITGQTILDILEHCASERLDVEDGWSGFLQVSGMKIVYDQRRDSGSRVVQVKILCTNCSVPRFEPLDTAKHYMVLMQRYLTSGRLYPMINKDNIIKTHNIGTLDSDILLDHIRKNSPITAGIEGRIRFLEEIEKESLCNKNSVQNNTPLIERLQKREDGEKIINRLISNQK